MKNKHEKIREKLVETATGLFNRFGFEKTTMNDIAREARKGKSSLYYYFKSKEEIFKAVVEVEAEEFKRIMEQNIPEISNAKEKIKTYFIIRMNHFRELTNLYAATRSDYLRKYDFVERIRAKYDQEELNFIKTLLDEGVDKGEFDITNTTDTSFALASAVKGLEFPLAINRNQQNLNERIEALTNILFYGIVIR